MCLLLIGQYKVLTQIPSVPYIRTVHPNLQVLTVQGSIYG